ncbi:MAG: rhomboid family protein [Lentisphaerae bacterium]|nr:rhomboid family protein [Lentisphaerota bacterium]
MNDISRQKCSNHPGREAVARCPVCERFFCRECVTEHEDRVICARCLARQSRARARSESPIGSLFLAIRVASATLVLCLLFYYLGQGLLRLPSAFHEGALWRDIPWETP